MEYRNIGMFGIKSMGQPHITNTFVFDFRY